MGFSAGFDESFEGGNFSLKTKIDLHQHLWKNECVKNSEF